MLMNSKLLIIAISGCILLYFSCRRTPDVSFEQKFEQRFFTIPSNTHPLVKIFSEKIKEQNKRYGFVNGLVRRTGFAYWNMSIIGQSTQSIVGRNTGGSDTTMLLIPFVKDNNPYVNSILYIRMTKEDTTYKLVYAEEYVNYGFDTTLTNHWDGRDVFHLFTIFDNMIFGHTKFKIKDSRLFGIDTSLYSKVVLTNGPGQNCEACRMML